MGSSHFGSREFWLKGIFAEGFFACCTIRIHFAMATIVCSNCKANIFKGVKFCNECGMESSGEPGKQCRTQVGTDAQAIIAAVNANTDKKIDALKSDIKTLGSEVQDLKNVVADTNTRMDKNEGRMDSFEAEISKVRDELQARPQEQKIKELEEALKEWRTFASEYKKADGERQWPASDRIGPLNHDSSYGKKSGEFQPRFVFVRGFAPIGSVATEKLTRDEYKA